MKKLTAIQSLFLFLNLFIFSGKALADEVNFNNGQVVLSDTELEKRQVEKIVERMVKAGRLSKEEGETARREIASISNENVEIAKSSVSRKIASTELER